MKYTEVKRATAGNLRVIIADLVFDGAEVYPAGGWDLTKLTGLDRVLNVVMAGDLGGATSQSGVTGAHGFWFGKSAGDVVKKLKIRYNNAEINAGVMSITAAHTKYTATIYGV